MRILSYPTVLVIGIMLLNNSIKAANLPLGKWQIIRVASAQQPSWGGLDEIPGNTGAVNTEYGELYWQKIASVNRKYTDKYGYCPLFVIWNNDNANLEYSVTIFAEFNTILNDTIAWNDLQKNIFYKIRNYKTDSLFYLTCNTGNPNVVCGEKGQKRINYYLTTYFDSLGFKQDSLVTYGVQICIFSSPDTTSNLLANSGYVTFLRKSMSDTVDSLFWTLSKPQRPSTATLYQFAIRLPLSQYVWNRCLLNTVYDPDMKIEKEAIRRLIYLIESGIDNMKTFEDIENNEKWIRDQNESLIQLRELVK